MPINTGAIVMGLLGFVGLFGGLAVALYYALEAGGYDEEGDGPGDSEPA
jgi:hypothetical protein